MITREITKELLEAAEEYPAVSVFGPRQSGKTTLVRETFDKLPYFSFENPDVRRAVQEDPRGFLNNLENEAVLDKIQRVPDLLSYLQERLDSKRKSCRFVLTGSHQPLLDQSVAQSLPGRTAVLTLMPFTLKEIASYGRPETIFELVHKGSFPRLHEHELRTERFYRSYVQTYVERDLRALIRVQDLDRFQQFMTLLAGRIGQLVNLNALSNDVGVSSTTLRHWLNALKASYLILELQPYHTNIRKRLVRSPKLYFTDTGLACYLLGISGVDQLKRDRLRGGLFENHVILDVYKTALNRGQSPKFYFYRDSQGLEVDLLIQKGRHMVPVEIKSSETFSVSFTKNIRKLSEILPDSLTKGYVVYAGEETFNIEEIRALRAQKPFSDVLLDEH